jgi:hypothetical protein
MAATTFWCTALCESAFRCLEGLALVLFFLFALLLASAAALPVVACLAVR